MWRRRLSSVMLTALAAALLWCPFGTAANASARETETGVRVLRVNDGDTITVRSGRRSERVRLIGIDAPELHQRPWGRRAKNHLADMISASGWNVTMEYDVDRRDKYGRLLAYVRTHDGRLVNEEMLRAGFAVLYTFPPNVRYVERFTAAQADARGRKVNIWGRGGLDERPSDYRRRHPH